MVDDRELWAFAMALLRQDPSDGGLFTAERIEALEAGGRESGLNVWREVADRMNAHVFEGLPPPS